MVKKILVRTLGIRGDIVQKLLDETLLYLKKLGFEKTPVIHFIDRYRIYKSVLMTQRQDSILLEYKQGKQDELLTLSFNNLSVDFIYDVLAMRYEQEARKHDERILVYKREVQSKK